MRIYVATLWSVDTRSNKIRSLETYSALSSRATAKRPRAMNVLSCCTLAAAAVALLTMESATTMALRKNPLIRTQGKSTQQPHQCRTRSAERRRAEPQGSPHDLVISPP